jgi:hypothetical protein
MQLLLLVVTLLVSTLATDAPTPHPEFNFCQPFQQGCASVAVCECVWLFTYCNVDDVADGQCKLTRYGIVGLTLLALTVAIVLAVVLGCCWCCCCRRCCKPRRADAAPVHYHFVSHPAQHHPPHHPLNMHPQVFSGYDEL